MNSLIKSSLLHSLVHSDECVIDAGQARSRTSHRKKEKDLTPEERARLMVARAREEADALVAEARAEAVEIRREAFRDGYESGIAALEADRQAAADHLAELESDVSQQLDQFWTDVEPQIVKLSVNIARKIVKHEIEENSDFVLNTVRSAIVQLRDRQNLRIRVNPADHEVARAGKEDIIASCDGIRNVEIVEDRRIDRGGCAIETGSGTIDARVDGQMKEIERVLMEAAEHAGH